MDREEIRELFSNKVKTALFDGDKTVSKKYQELLDQDIDKERIIEILAFGNEIIEHKIAFFGQKSICDWNSFFTNMTLDNHIGEYSYDKQDERRNLRTIAKKYGQIKKQTNQFELELGFIETKLWYYYKRYSISSYDARKIINIVIDRLMNIETHDTSDYTDYGHEDLLFMADDLELGCNPYINNELKDYLSKFINVDDACNFDRIFKNVFLCLARIIASIDLWDKELGKDGYYKFIGKHFFNKGYVLEVGEFIYNDQTLDKNLNN